MALIILTKEFGGIVRLNGVDGESSVYSRDSNLFVQGKVCLSIRLADKDYVSLPNDIQKETLRIVKTGNDYFLDQMTVLSVFSFTKTITVFKNEISPYLYTDQIALIKLTAFEVSFESLAISIIGEIKTPDIRRNVFYYDSSLSAVMLNKLQSPSTGRFGFQLSSKSDGVMLSTGAPSSGLKLSKFGTVTMDLSAGSLFNFNLSNLSLELKASKAAHAVIIDSRSDWELDQNFGLGFSLLKIEKLVCSNGWIDSVEFTSKETTISKIHPDDKIGHHGTRTKVLTSTDRLSFHYPMEVNTTKKVKADFLQFEGSTFLDSPHFVYSNNFSEKVTLKNQHYGIRFRGLNNEKGASVKLDSDLAVLRWDKDKKLLFLQAGDTVTVKGKTGLVSKVLPKMNQQENGDRLVRIPALPSSILVRGEVSRSSFAFNTLMNAFTINFPELETSPFAPGNLSSQGDVSFHKMNWKSQINKLAFDLTVDKVMPVNHKWLEDFSINPATRSFELLDSQNAKVVYDKTDPIGTKNVEVVTTVITTTSVNTAEREKLTYIAYAGAFVFAGAAVTGGLICRTAKPSQLYKCLGEKGEEFINIKFDTIKDGPAEVAKYLKNGNLNELQVVYYENNAKIKRFIDDNIELTEPTERDNISIGFWPILKMVGIPLVKKDWTKEGIVTSYCFDIVNLNLWDLSISVGLGFDQNKEGGIDLNQNFGFDAASFKSLANEFPVLFPSYTKSEGTNGKIDPTSGKFTGVIFRNMPMMVQMAATDIPEMLADLIDAINKNLFLEFGWRDEKGVSWISRIPEAVTSRPGYKGIDILDFDLIKFNVKKIFCTGQESKLQKFSFELFLGLIKIKPDEYKFSIQADALMTFDDGKVDNFLITPHPSSSGLISVDDTIPGFEYIRFKEFNTNFKQLFASVELFPDKKLIEALPIFETYNKAPEEPDLTHILRTVAAFDMSGKSAVVSIFLDTSKSIKVFSKWPMAIKVINIFINSTNKNTIEVIGEFNLGLENFLKVGGKIVIAHESSGSWDFDIQLDRVGGSLALSDELKVEGLFKWGGSYPSGYYDDPQSFPREPLKKASIDEGSERPFMGILGLKAPSMFGSFDVFAKIGSKNGMPYSLFGLRLGQEINLGFGKLLQPEFLISKNADNNKSIENIVINGAFDGIEALKGPIDLEERIKWLEKFDYSDKTGLTLLASGKLQYGVITREPKGITGVLYSSKGVLRIEGWLKITGIDGEIQVIYAIDFVKKRLMVGFQLPTFYFPTKDNPSLVFQPGQVRFGTNFGGAFYLLFTLGWPPQIGGSSYERDWNKANQATWHPGGFPIPNLVAAGVMYELDIENEFILFGAAVRAGWTYSIDFSIGKAGLEVTFGGLLVIKISTKNSAPSLVNLKKGHIYLLGNENHYNYYEKSPLTNSDLALMDSIYQNFFEVENDLEIAQRKKLSILGEVFADLKGYAEVKIFGITLAGVYLNAYARMRVCGDTEKGITHIGGAFGAQFCVKVGCLTKCKSVDIAVTVVSGPCEAEPLNYQFLPQLN